MIHNELIIELNIDETLAKHYGKGDEKMKVDKNG